MGLYNNSKCSIKFYDALFEIAMVKGPFDA